MESSLKNNYDPLTGLYNRAYFTEELTCRLLEQERKSHKLALIFIDVDHFKWVNDLLGHDVGDDLLMRAAMRIQACVGKGGFAARLGGDEFTVIIDQIQTLDAVREMSETIINAFKEPFPLGGHEIRITLSLGISLYPDHGNTTRALMKYADRAVYQTKSAGRNSYSIYQASNDTEDQYRLLFASQFDKALSGNQFFLEYQPRIELGTGEIRSLEALVRWNHPEKGRIEPSRFIPIAEETGFIVPLGEWIMKEACLQNKIWQRRGLPPIRVALNVSANQLYDSAFLSKMNRILADTELDPFYLEIEITESILMKDAKNIIAALKALKAMKVYVSIDDFGTGYSSLNYLKRFAVDALKIDQSFIKDLPRDKGLTKMIISLAKKLKLDVIAEGVETQAQHMYLLNNGCHDAQGFLYSKPLPAVEIERLLKA